MQVKRGFFKTGTGSPGTVVSVTGVGFALKFLVLMWNGRTETANASGLQTFRRGIGFCTGPGSDISVTSMSRHNVSPPKSAHDMYESRAVFAISDAGGGFGELDLTAVTADGFDMQVAAAFGANLTIEYLAFGGPDITNVALVSLQEPAAACVVNADSIGFRPDMAMFAMNPGGAASAGIGGDSRMHFGAFAGDSAIVNATWGGGSNDGANPSNASAYCRLGECIGVLNSELTEPNSRARVTARRDAGLELTFDEVSGGGNREVYILAVKGGQWNIGSFTTSTDLADKTVGGLGFNAVPRGGIVVSACHQESALDVANTGDEWSMGFFTGAGDRAVMAVEELDNCNPSVVQSAYAKDAVYLGCNASGGIDSRVDILSLAENTLTFKQESVDISGRFAWVLAFSDSIKRELIGNGNIMGGVLSL
jgi:hypothetical protein